MRPDPEAELVGYETRRIFRWHAEHSSTLPPQRTEQDREQRGNDDTDGDEPDGKTIDPAHRGTPATGHSSSLSKKSLLMTLNDSRPPSVNERCSTSGRTTMPSLRCLVPA